MLMILAMLVLLIGFFALFGALVRFTDGVIRLPVSAERNGSRSRR